jgi:hypothetical protein
MGIYPGGTENFKENMIHDRQETTVHVPALSAPIRHARDRCETGACIADVLF